MDEYLKKLKGGLSSGISQMLNPKQVPKTPVVAPVSTPTVGNPSAVSPVVKTPAAQKFIKNQVAPVKPLVTTPTTPVVPPIIPTVTAPIIPSQTPQNAPQTPSARDSYIQAYKTYQDTLKNNERERQAQEALNKFQEEQSKAIIGQEGRGLGIPISLVRGEQERITRLNQPTEAKLQRDIQIAQESQKGAVEAAKTGVEFQKELMGTEKPIEVGGVLYAKQEDGNYKPLTTKYQTPSEQYGTGSIGEYNFAKSQGYKGSFTDYQNEDANRKRSIAAAGIATESGLNSKQVPIFNSLVDKLNKSPLIAANDRAVILKDVTDAVSKDPTNASLQVSFIYSLIQALDTYQSAVREGEIGLLSSTQGLGEKLANLPNKISSGTPLAPSKIAEYVQTSKLLTDSINSAAETKKRQFGAQANIAGIGTAFDEYTKATTPQKKETTTTDFSDIEANISIEGKNAYIPRSVWASLGDRKDALIAEARTDGFTLLVRD